MDGAGAPSSSATSSSLTVLKLSLSLSSSCILSALSVESLTLVVVLLFVFRQAENIRQLLNSFAIILDIIVVFVIIICAKPLLLLQKDDGQLLSPNTILSSQEQFTQPHLPLGPFRQAHFYLQYLLPLPLGLLASQKQKKKVRVSCILSPPQLLLLRPLGHVTFPNWLKLPFGLADLSSSSSRNTVVKNTKAQQGQEDVRRLSSHHHFLKKIRSSEPTTGLSFTPWDYSYSSELFRLVSSLVCDKSQDESLKPESEAIRRDARQVVVVVVVEVKGILKKKKVSCSFDCNFYKRRKRESRAKPKKRGGETRLLRFYSKNSCIIPCLSVIHRKRPTRVSYRFFNHHHHFRLSSK